MARYCIYCGHALGKGEKCACRQAQGRTGAAGATNTANTANAAGQSRTGAAQNATAPGSTSPGDAAGHSKKGQRNDWEKRWQAWRREQEQTRRQRAANRNAGWRKAGKADGTSPFSRRAGKVQQDFMMHLPSILNRLHKAIRYVRQPVDAIRLSVQYPVGKRTYSFLALLTVMAGLVFTSAVRNPQFARISGNVTTLPRLLLFAEGMALGIAAILLMALFYRLAILLLHRRRYPYQALFDALSPVSLYAGLALLLVFLSLQTSLFSAVTVFAVGLGVSHLVQYFVIRQLTNLDENHSAILVLFVNLLCMSAIGVVLSIF